MLLSPRFGFLLPEAMKEGPLLLLGALVRPLAASKTAWTLFC
jgi:hypothetical protein